jgi:chaperonin cofactor prefoldin
MLELDERPIRDGREDRRDAETRVVERPRNRGLWAAFVLLLVALIGAAGYGYRTLKNDRIDLARVPEMAQALAGLSARLEAAENAMRAWTSDKQGLTDRLGLLERKMNSTLQQARKHADELTAQVQAQLVDEMDERGAVVDARINKIEAAQVEEQTKLARLQGELASAREEIASLRQTSDREFAGLGQRMSTSDRAVEALEQRLDRQKVNFEVARNHTVELTRGVALKVLDTDVRYQRFSGWIQLLPEARYLWVDEHGIQQPVVFYRQQDGERLDLVVTRVAGNSVVGYLVMPVAPRTQAGAPVARLNPPAPVAELGE